MSRVLGSVVPIVVGVLLAARALLPGFSLSNIVNLLGVALGAWLVFFGIRNWGGGGGKPTLKETATRAEQAPVEPERHPPNVGSTPQLAQIPAIAKGPVRRWYVAYLKFLVILPIAVAIASGIASKAFGCRWTAATMNIAGCGAVGQFFTQVFLYAGLFSVAMITLLVPAAIVFGAAVLNERKGR